VLLESTKDTILIRYIQNFINDIISSYSNFKKIYSLICQDCGAIRNSDLDWYKPLCDECGCDVKVQYLCSGKHYYKFGIFQYYVDKDNNKINNSVKYNFDM